MWGEGEVTTYIDDKEIWRAEQGEMPVQQKEKDFYQWQKCCKTDN
jgi:hypothetical protein